MSAIKDSEKIIEVELKKKGVYKNLITGGISASIARTISNPLERVEILRQIQSPEFKGLSIMKSLSKIYESQGINGIFKGNVASVVRIFPMSAFEFYFYELSKNVIIRGNPKRQKSFIYNFICGAFSGWASSSLTYPLEVARTRLAASSKESNLNEHNIRTSLKNLWRDNGIRGLFKGYWLGSYVSSIVKIRQ